MKVFHIDNAITIESHLRKNTDLNIYSIGDLDDFFREYTTWFAIGSEECIENIALLYSGFEIPTFIALTDKITLTMEELIRNIKTKLPEKFYTHLSPGLIKVFGEETILNNFGTHYKMALKNKSLLIQSDDTNSRRLNKEDFGKIKKLFELSYPENFFDKRMLETGKYFGYFDKDKLVGIAGIHVYSERYRVAALGNITTDINYRGRSIAKKLTSVLCNDLLETVDNIGLNVYMENFSAINCYKKIGFEITGTYEEYLLEIR